MEPKLTISHDASAVIIHINMAAANVIDFLIVLVSAEPFHVYFLSRTSWFFFFFFTFLIFYRDIQFKGVAHFPFWSCILPFWN